MAYAPATGRDSTRSGSLASLPPLLVTQLCALWRLPALETALSSALRPRYRSSEQSSREE